ncbi:hypothetical protein JCM10207_004246 [Rhodosporidiobolus poonsookiae]
MASFLSSFGARLSPLSSISKRSSIGREELDEYFPAVCADNKVALRPYLVPAFFGESTTSRTASAPLQSRRPASTAETVAPRDLLKSRPSPALFSTRAAAAPLLCAFAHSTAPSLDTASVPPPVAAPVKTPFAAEDELVYRRGLTALLLGDAVASSIFYDGGDEQGAWDSFWLDQPNGPLHAFVVAEQTETVLSLDQQDILADALATSIYDSFDGAVLPAQPPRRTSGRPLRRFRPLSPSAAKRSATPPFADYISLEQICEELEIDLDAPPSPPPASSTAGEEDVYSAALDAICDELDIEVDYSRFHRLRTVSSSASLSSLSSLSSFSSLSFAPSSDCSTDTDSLFEVGITSHGFNSPSSTPPFSPRGGAKAFF